MGMIRFKAPALPIPNREYDEGQQQQLNRALRLYFDRLDSTTPIQVESIVLTNVPTSGYNLPVGSVYRDGDSLKIVLADLVYAPSFAATASVGTVVVNT
jgi:hypothetical protein